MGKYYDCSVYENGNIRICDLGINIKDIKFPFTVDNRFEPCCIYNHNYNHAYL